MSKILILNGGYSEIPLIEAAIKLHDEVIITGRNCNAPGNKLGHKYVEGDYSDKESIYQLAQKLNVDCICAGCNDKGYLTAAYVCERLGLPGHDTYDVATKLHHKDKFRALLSTLGLPAPESYVINKDDSVEELKNINFPVIIKPTDLCGGMGMKKCYSLSDIEHGIDDAFSYTKRNQIVVESFIEGENHGFTAFIENKKVVFYFVDDEYHSYEEYSVSAATSTDEVDDETINNIISQIELLATALNLCDGVVHTQFILNNNIPVILEVCRRCPGDLYPHLVRNATGCDYAGQIVLAESGYRYNFESRREVSNNEFWVRQVVGYFEQGCVNSVIIDDELKQHIVEKYIYYSLNHSVELGRLCKIGAIMLKFDSMEELKNTMKTIHTRITVL